jgi:Fic family protein
MRKSKRHMGQSYLFTGRHRFVFSPTVAIFGIPFNFYIMQDALLEIIQRINRLQTQTDALRPLDKEQEMRLLQKLRLDWNYHSCNVEGNTLTYGETKDLLLFGITAQGKPLKDHIELKGHNQAVEWILDVVKSKSRPLTENFIRELHELIIAPDSYTDSITPEGIPVKKKILIGEYKKMPNHVRTQTGEMFYFSSPEETPAQMHDLLEWLRQAEAENKTHPLITACLFHYRFVRIHPFDDGNGRMARILMNFILMMHGYPPVIVPTTEKTAYLRALELADQEDIDRFVIYIGEKLIASQVLVLKAARGEDVEEEADLDKMIAILDKRMENVEEGKAVTKVRSVEVQQDLFESCFNPLFQKLFPRLNKFDKYFDRAMLTVQNDYRTKNPEGVDQLGREVQHLLGYDNYPGIIILYQYKSLLKLGLVHYDITLGVWIRFEKLSYRIQFGYVENDEATAFLSYEKLYHQILYSDEVNAVAQRMTKYLIEKIEQELGKIENGSNGPQG